MNAARETYVRRPHFRHSAGTEKRSCLVLAARAAVLATLQSTGYLDLPRRSRAARVTGLSGNFHDAWVEAPPERVHIASCRFFDEAAAIVTLDDGRDLRVTLIGSHDGGTDGTAHAAIEVRVDDPALAAMSPQELRERTRLLVSEAHWCGHWQDSALLDAAMQQARARAADAFDLVDGETGLPEDATPQEIRETLLHRKAKEILEREKCLMVPPLGVTEPAPQWPHKPNTRQVRAARKLELHAVSLERRTGRIIPDVTATTLPAPGWPAESLLVEITVTNGITDERRARIREVNLPALEIDLSRLGGKVTEGEFARLIVEEMAGKRWLHHPAIEAERSRLRAQWAASGTAHTAPRSATHLPERSAGGSHGDGRYPSQRYVEPKKTDFWLKGDALERWKREHPEAAANWFSKKD
ncbi:hypothetical protein [Paraburkholderia youngii]|uniref:hypothetical protein n=1 Tax=Paraburkholderia youngii TaxID=2782701 RepID=UPI003D1E0F54